MPLSDSATDSIGQRCAVMKCYGDTAGGSAHFAYRTSGPFGSSDGATIRSTASALLANSPGRLYNMVHGLEPSTQYYWGATLDAGSASVSGSFLTSDLPPDQASGGIKLPGVWI